jgi:hypothetical protein
MRFLADENVEQPILESLRSLGHDVTSIGDTTPGAPDPRQK